MTDATDPMRNTPERGAPAPDGADVEGNYTEVDLGDGTEAGETGGEADGEYTETDFSGDEEE
ncbi:hypothetical protein BJ978_001593 [Agromyces terreus]|uniref:Uncharacterized protein n=1 Tax=Agromyces terreus TaxID=424795 RepID=A0A9X2KES0_9MICO|nr:hypothetical protein [Agromyces terreus]MCP2370917.1 hypothetical protein [Agromyces terreus]